MEYQMGIGWVGLRGRGGKGGMHDVGVLFIQIDVSCAVEFASRD